MKKLILFLALVSGYHFCYSQNSDNARRDFSPYGLDYDHLSFQMRQLAQHGCATQITYFDLNFVDGLFQEFMKKRLSMVIDNVSKFTKKGTYQIFTVSYAQMATIGRRVPHLYFKYTIFDNKDKHPVIKSLLVTGSATSVINFFVSYWPTRINFNEKRTKIAYNYLLQDKATIRINPNNSSWSISVENKAIVSIDEYYSQISNTAKNIQPKITTSTNRNEPVRVFYSRNEFLQDSLTTVALSYHLIYASERALDINSLKSRIDEYEKYLLAGKNYNETDISKSLATLQKMLNLEKNTVGYNTFLLLKVDTSGNVIVFPYGSTPNFPNKIIDLIRLHFADNKISPFVAGGRRFNSYKNIAISHSLQPYSNVKIINAGSLTGNPNIIWENK